MGLRTLLQRLLPADATTPPGLAEEVRKLRYESDYLQLEVSRLRSLVRYLTADIIHDLPMQRQTKDSFDYQWGHTDDGSWIDNHPEIREREPRLVCQYSGLPRDWFTGKTVLDAGCGSGRFSWAMASMGALVTALDQSASGVDHTRRACAEFGDRVVVRQHDLTRPIDLSSTFDLVWSFGVLHHTGNTYGAFSNIASLVKPGGYIFLMLYGEPTGRDSGEFAYYTEVESLRRHTSVMSFDDRLKFLQGLKGDQAGGWFDAVSPEINDTYSFYEIQLWLQRAGFGDIRRTMDHASHHVIARKVS
ncbi:class I SAM-dependent methyltransferase [Youhaiella tibetensis]|uniref:Class I SAM-dependent methyltransferase n=1 Tax=Paradevosia tibetensis TaxID=1447062 RepID=A0A5B9DIS4_9HYPH|nr:class I SAM-dependent methyltransferase [Youhaiella tibetensis]